MTLVAHGGSVQRGVSLQTIRYVPSVNRYVPSVNVELSDIVREGAAEKNENKTRRKETLIIVIMLGE